MVIAGAIVSFGFGVQGIARAFSKPTSSHSIVSLPQVFEQTFQNDYVGKVEGITTFRGNHTRTWYGKGPVPESPVVSWRYPEKPMCSHSTSEGVDSLWCGNGWTGQPIVWERPDGITEVIFGAYDRSVHFVDARTGKDTRPPFATGDIIKGTVTLDPDGLPFLYFGSRDNYLRIVSLAGPVPVELWKKNSEDDKGLWNNDWDASPLVVGDMLYTGAENGWFYAIKLNKKYNNEQVSVSPEVVFKTPTYTDELVSRVGKNVSVESSVMISDDRVYVANSGGRVLGFDISDIEQGIAPTVFDYWVGDDIDATLIADGEGMIYVTSELERFTERSLDQGQLIKLNPFAKDPYVWGIQIPGETADSKGGAWATPALYEGYLYLPTHKGDMLVVDSKTGEVVSREQLGSHAWGSPSIIGKTLVVPSCKEQGIRAYTLLNPRAPELLWNMPVGEGCIESTPSIWKDQIFFGSRDGYFYKLGDSR